MAWVGAFLVAECGDGEFAGQLGVAGVAEGAGVGGGGGGVAWTSVGSWMAASLCSISLCSVSAFSPAGGAVSSREAGCELVFALGPGDVAPDDVGPDDVGRDDVGPDAVDVAGAGLGSIAVALSISGRPPSSSRI